MGALIMSHSDDNGLVLPPKLAPIQVVIVPVFKNAEQLAEVSAKAVPLKKALEAQGISVKYDDRDTHKPGWKFAEYEFKGVPVRITIGPRDIEQGTVEVARRDTLEKETFQLTDIENKIIHLLSQIQKNLYDRALDFRENNSFRVDTWEEFKNVLDTKGGFIYAHWDGTAETEEKIKEETKATIRVIPFNNTKENGKCVYSGRPSTQRVVFARSY
jgi:prolyl-tRNA synthetase